MSEHNHGASNVSIPVNLPAKRKRGRPRKDGNLPRSNSMEGSSRVAVNTASNVSTRTSIQNIEANPPNEGSAIGKSVSGVIDGCFGAGFTISVRINGGPLHRGLVFEPGRAAHLTGSNDVAPQASMLQRSEIPVPFSFSVQQNQINNVGSQSVMKQPAQLGLQEQPVPVALHQILSSVAQPGSGSASGSGSRLDSPLQLMNHSQSPTSLVSMGNMLNNNITSPTLAEKMMMQQQTPRSTFGNQFQSCPPLENLRMVEQDDTMQVYEVSVRSEGLSVDTHERGKDLNSDSASETRANNVLYQKEISNQVAKNPDMGSFSNNFNCFGTENHHVTSEAQNGQSSGKQNQDPYYEHHHHDVVNEPQSLTPETPKEQKTQNMLQGIYLELHETPIVTQNQYPQQENQYVHPDNESRRTPEHEMNIASPNTIHSISVEPANIESQPDPGKMVHYELGSKNHHGIKEAFVSSNSHFVHRELFPKSVEFVTQRPNVLKNEREEDCNRSILSEKPIHESSVNGEVDSLTAENARAAMPFDLEIAAEETLGPERLMIFKSPALLLAEMN